MLLLALVVACYLPPVAAPVTDPFVAPACAYCPGHRGNGYDLPPGSVVRAVAPGEVTFAGVVVGVRYIVVRHDDGISATYGRLRDNRVRVGERIAAGQVVATSTATLYVGLKAADDTPLDPALYLAVSTRRPRLVPTDGSPARPAAERAPSCPAVVRTGAGAR